MFSEIHFWCHTRRPLGGQHGSWSNLFRRRRLYRSFLSCNCDPLVFFLNAFSEFSNKKFVIRARTCHSATSCVRDQHATPEPARHMWETGSLNQAKFMLHWSSVSLNSLKVLPHLGKTPLRFIELKTFYFLLKLTNFHLIKLGGLDELERISHVCLKMYLKSHPSVLNISV